MRFGPVPAVQLTAGKFQTPYRLQGGCVSSAIGSDHTARHCSPLGPPRLRLRLRLRLALHRPPPEAARKADGISQLPACGSGTMG